MWSVVTFNVNGLRSAINKGLFSWLSAQNFDVICLQEIKIDADALRQLPALPGYHLLAQCAKRPGYSGVAAYVKQVPEQWSVESGWSLLDEEGRYLKMDWKHLTVICLYLPSGTSGPHRQAIKDQSLQHLQEVFRQLSPERPTVLCADWNIAPQFIDLKRAKENQGHSGFLPNERAWIESLQSDGWHDAFRLLHPQEIAYTWWSTRGKARQNNVGWRIDYLLINDALKKYLSAARIDALACFSDHAPCMAYFSDEAYFYDEPA